VFIAVGAAFDFAAGTKPEAPAFLHATGLEWLYRFASEPKRLWRRYTIGNAIFIEAVAIEEWRRIRGRS
jgi:N-acetylglucosaminyldiphosphoundecaprenol N-acetyl-beta-D-mannosaminyltransferase